MELAISNDLSPAYAIATALEKIQRRDIRAGENEEEKNMRQEIIDTTLSHYLKRIKVEHLSELA